MTTVWDKIPEILQTRKGKDFGIVAVVILTGVVSFGLGRLSTDTVEHGPVTLFVTGDASTVAAQDDTLAAAGGAALVTAGHTTAEEPTTKGTPAVDTARTDGYVASKNGTAYHLPWCPGAKRIKPENKVWFETKERAEAAGYSPAGNCKGI